MRAINIWAWQASLPGIPGYERTPVCSDGSASATRMGDASAPWLRDQQWHLALPFASLEDLADRLSNLELPDFIQREPRRLQRGEIQTLAIDCHGSAGRFYPAGVRSDLAITARNLDRHGEALRQIGLMTASEAHQAVNPLERPPFAAAPTEFPASTILIVACNTAAGPQGSRLLIQLSYRWPGRSVVGFSTTVMFPGMRGRASDPLSGQACVPPFALDGGDHHIDREQAADELMHSDVAPEHLPYANATAANAKIARDGHIIETPLNESAGSSARHTRLMGAPRRTLARPTFNPHATRVRA